MVNAQNRGVRIIQYPVEDAQELYISGWLDTFDLYEEKPPIDELVIDLVLSEEAKDIAEKWIEAWLVDGLDKEQLEIYIQAQMVLVD